MVVVDERGGIWQNLTGFLLYYVADIYLVERVPQVPGSPHATAAIDIF